MFEQLALAGLWLVSASFFGCLFTCLAVVRVLDVSWSTALSVVVSVLLDLGERSGRFARETARKSGEVQDSTHR